MKPIVVLGLGFTIMAAGGFGSPQGTFGAPGGTFGSPPASGGSPGPFGFGAPRGVNGGGQSPSHLYRPAPQAPYAPIAPIGAVRPVPTLGAQQFKPFKGTSTLSDRGGLNSDPKPKKPKGYVPYETRRP